MREQDTSTTATTGLRDYTKLQRLAARSLFLGLVAALLFAIFYKFDDLSYQSYLQDTRLETSVALIATREQVEQEVMDLILDLNELGAVIGQNPEMSDFAFNLMAEDLIASHGEVRHIAVAPAGQATKVFPLYGAELPPGLADTPRQHAGVAERMRQGEGLITGPVPLADGARGLLLRKPVYSYAVDGARSDWGLLTVLLDYDRFMARIGVLKIESAYDLLISGTDPWSGNAPVTLWGAPDLIDKNPIQLDFNLPIGSWQFAAVPEGGWAKHHPDYIYRWTQWGLLTISLMLVAWYVITLLERRHEAERLLSTGIEALDHGFVMFDKDRRLVAFNKKYKQLAGGSGMVKIGSRYEDIVVANLRQGLIPDAVGREKEWYEEWSKRLDDKAADKEQILADGRLIRAYDRPMEDGSVVGLRIDITDLKKAQVAAEAANQAKTDFMGVLSHELRTPLTVILGHAQLAKNIERMPVYTQLIEAVGKHPNAAPEVLPHCAALSEQIAKMMLALERSGNHLFTLISEILDFAKIDSGTLSMDMQPVTGAEIVLPIVDQMRPLVEDKGLYLRVEEAECDLRADRQRIQQVVINLIGNASKFTDEGGITVALSTEGDEVVISVTDTGIGIPEDQVGRVFEAFHQVDSSSGRKYGGTGLGLAISADIARAHDGSLSASSVLGEGSTFTLRLPRAETPKAPRAPRAPEAATDEDQKHAA